MENFCLFSFRFELKKFLSLLIVTSLLITTPGLDCYEALAQIIQINGRGVDCSITSHLSCPSGGKTKEGQDGQKGQGARGDREGNNSVEQKLRGLGIAPQSLAEE
ncbi:MAG: hypothetical protein AAB091_04340, partial [Elusimicrobiota bacterium]